MALNAITSVSDTKTKERELFFKAEPFEIRQQLDRLLADPLFRNSRRYPKLLQFVVERTLDNNEVELKERTLGVDVFGRIPDYDTGTDPVVRITAAEVRKRLAQYYSNPGHEHEIRIGLPSGSYVPEFHLPASLQPEPPPSLPVVTLPIAPAAATVQRDRLSYRWLFLAIAGVAALGYLAFWQSRAPARALDAFWRPLLGDSETVMLSVGQRDEPVSPSPHDRAVPDSLTTLSQLYYLQSQNVAMPDVVALAHLGGLMQSRRLHYRIRGAQETTLSDFRESSVILVGAFTNPWNIRLNKPLRFSFERHDSLFFIRDGKNPSQIKWSVDFETPFLKLATDYALITRVREPASDRLVVSAGGLSGYGTQAASEFLTEAAYIQKLGEIAPRDWEHKNLQIVISTRVINGRSGPPEIVSAIFW